MFKSESNPEQRQRHSITHLCLGLPLLYDKRSTWRTITTKEVPTSFHLERVFCQQMCQTCNWNCLCNTYNTKQCWCNKQEWLISNKCCPQLNMFQLILCCTICMYNKLYVYSIEYEHMLFSLHKKCLHLLHFISFSLNAYYKQYTWNISASSCLID